MRPLLPLLVAALLAFASLQLQAAERPPNLVIVFVDDLGYGDVGCFGQEHIKTPELDRMAAEGLRLTQHYCGAPVCAPSRFTLLTGRHIGRSHTVGQGQELPAATQTLGTVAKRAGYATAAIGKWGLGDKSGHPNRQGFDHWFGFLSQTRAHFYYPDWVWRNGGKVAYPDNPQTHATYIHDAFTSEALAFIDAHRSEPFLLYIPYTIPHAEVLVPEDSQAPYIDTLGDPERGPIEKPYRMKGYNQPRYPRAARAGMISRLDRDVGRIRARLAEHGLSEDTLIVFTSDNGPCPAGGQDIRFFNSAGGLRGLKRSLYEGGIRMPTIICWPGVIEPGRESGEPSISYDWLPTLAELAGITLEQPTDGRSLLPLLRGETDDIEREHLFWSFARRGDVGTVSALREGDWKLVAHHGDEAKQELFDLSVDRNEAHDLSTEQPERVQRMLDVIQGYRPEGAPR